MGRAIKSTCSHCQREIYFDPTVGVSFDALSALECSECGQSGAVLTLNIEAPPDAPILDRLPRAKEPSPSVSRAV
jgi:hypothetical protein